MKIIHLAPLVTGLLFASLTHAESMIEGIYTSPAGDNGRGACTLEVKSIGKSPKYGDELYSLQSSGEGACEWTAIGLAKNFKITAGIVTSGGYTGFIAANWPFGPGGSQLTVASFNPDGSARNNESFAKQ